MARRVFYSFHFQHDYWRVGQVKRIGAIAGQPVLQPNKWEEVKQGGDAAIKRWIDENMRGTSCNVVLIGSHTYDRRWVQHEIIKAWNDHKGVVGIHIHRLEDNRGFGSTVGRNPLSRVFLRNGTVTLSSVVRTYDPIGRDGKAVYASIEANIEAWVEEAIRIRDQWRG